MSGGQVGAPIVVRCQGGAGGSQGAQHSKSLEAWFGHVPGLKVTIPSTPEDAYWLLLRAIENDDPVVFVETASLYTARGPLDPDRPPADLGTATVRREGRDATVVAWGATVPVALEAAARLRLRGHRARGGRTGLLAVVHEAWGTGGLGAEVAAGIAERSFDSLEGPILRIAAPPCPHPFSPGLERAMLPDAERVAAAVRTWLAGSDPPTP